MNDEPSDLSSFATNEAQPGKVTFIQTNSANELLRLKLRCYNFIH
jgi:hypothetical protein